MVVARSIKTGSFLRYLIESRGLLNRLNQRDWTDMECRFFGWVPGDPGCVPFNELKVPKRNGERFPISAQSDRVF
jgi:hypothetical protein